MEVTLTPIGNSQGIRIPKSVLKQVGFHKTVKLSVKDRTIILSSTLPRQSWDQIFSQAKDNISPSPTPLITNTFDKNGWTW